MVDKTQFDTWDDEAKCQQLQKRFGDYDEFETKKGNKENKAPIFDLMYRLLNKHNGNLELLDVGCGPGHFLWSFRNNVSKLVGLDYSPHMLKLAKGQLDKCNIKSEFMQGSCWDISLPDNYVDVSLQVDVCMHIGGSWESIKEMIRVSSRYVVFTGPSFEDFNNEMNRKIGGKFFAVSVPLLIKELDKLVRINTISTYQFLERPKTKTYGHKILFIKM